MGACPALADLASRHHRLKYDRPMDDQLPGSDVVGIITPADMFGPVLAADPSFLPAWKEFQEDYGDEPQPLYYLALAALSRPLIAALERNETSRFDTLFDIVEQWHLTGDAYVREAATIGLLESLQNTGLHRKTTPEDFLIWLRPESRRWWDKVEAFWEHGTLIRDN
jgi:hypothetical protein